MSTKKEIRSTARALSSRLHPDVVARRENLGSTGRAEAAEAWEAVKVAESILSDDKSRFAHDAIGDIVKPKFLEKIDLPALTDFSLYLLRSTLRDFFAHLIFIAAINQSLSSLFGFRQNLAYMAAIMVLSLLVRFEPSARDQLLRLNLLTPGKFALLLASSISIVNSVNATMSNYLEQIWPLVKQRLLECSEPKLSPLSATSKVTASVKEATSSREASLIASWKQRGVEDDYLEIVAQDEDATLDFLITSSLLLLSARPIPSTPPPSQSLALLNAAKIDITGLVPVSSGQPATALHGTSEAEALPREAGAPSLQSEESLQIWLQDILKSMGNGSPADTVNEAKTLLNADLRPASPKAQVARIALVAGLMYYDQVLSYLRSLV